MLQGLSTEGSSTQSLPPMHQLTYPHFSQNKRHLRESLLTHSSKGAPVQSPPGTFKHLTVTYFLHYHLSLPGKVDEYVHLYTCVYTCTHMCERTYTHTCIYTYMHMWIHAVTNAANAHAVRNKKIESCPQGTHRPPPVDRKYFPYKENLASRPST